MKKIIKYSLITLASLLILIIVLGFGGWFYIKSTFLNFEKGYDEAIEIKEITITGYTFLDRNNNGKLDVYEDDRQSTDDRVADILSQMTVEEKIHLLKGSGMASAMGWIEPGKGIPGVVGTIVPTPRLGLPAINLSDGPAGLRIEPTRKNEDLTYHCTAFPIGTLLSSTWNVDLVQEVGQAMGNEALEYGIDVILGPGANIQRHPFCGRNFEYYSEDPFLTGFIGAAMVNGIESNGVGSSVKHYVANNQETNRNFNDVIVSERALREIYLKGFEIIVKKSQPWTIMSSYNLVNGTYVAENRRLLTDIPRNEWGFEGLIMSDWFGGQDAPAMIRAGNDLIEPGTKKQWKALKKAYDDGDLPLTTIDTSVKRILKLIVESKKMQNYQFSNNPDLNAHAGITRKAAAEGMVLMKNDQSLPIEKVKNITLLGIRSYDLISGGTGSGDVNEAYSVSLKEGLENAGFQINALAERDYENHKSSHSKSFVKKEGILAMLNPYSPPEISYTTEQLQQFASDSDLAIITIGRNSGEGGDRTEEGDFLLTENEKEMIRLTCQYFHAENKKVIVVLNIGGVIETASWKEEPDAILLAWQGGQEGGNAIADILIGKVNPSGKLPMTFPINIADHASNANFPLDGRPFDPMAMFAGKEKPEDEKIKNEDFTNYEEGIYVGYRHFDKAGLAVSYPFGYGLSYTDFEYRDMQASVVNDTIKVALQIQNTGDIAGKEVVQIYVSKPSTSIDRPVQELKSFVKTPILNPDESVELVIDIPVSEMSYWDENLPGWKLEYGLYTINAGTSSRDIRLTKEVEIEN